MGSIKQRPMICEGARSPVITVAATVQRFIIITEMVRLLRQNTMTKRQSALHTMRNNTRSGRLTGGERKPDGNMIRLAES